jgi:hypothetical protein
MTFLIGSILLKKTNYLWRRICTYLTYLLRSLLLLSN